MDLNSLNIQGLINALAGKTVYLTFTLIGTLLIIFSIIYDRYIYIGVSVLLYSLVSVLALFLEKDLQRLFPSHITLFMIAFYVFEFIVIGYTGFLILSNCCLN